MVSTIIVCLHNRTQCLLRREGAGRPSFGPQGVWMRLFLCTTTHLSIRLSRGSTDRVGEGMCPYPDTYLTKNFGRVEVCRAQEGCVC